MMGTWEWYMRHPPYQPSPPRRRDPHDISTWGPACQRGLEYIVTGAPAPAGTPGQVRKFSAGRKARGSAAGDHARSGAA